MRESTSCSASVVSQPARSPSCAPVTSTRLLESTKDSSTISRIGVTIETGWYRVRKLWLAPVFSWQASQFDLSRIQSGNVTPLPKVCTRTPIVFWVVDRVRYMRCLGRVVHDSAENGPTMSQIRVTIENRVILYKEALINTSVQLTSFVVQFVRYLQWYSITQSSYTGSEVWIVSEMREDRRTWLGQDWRLYGILPESLD